MYRLFHKIPKGLEPVANIFKQVWFLLIVNEENLKNGRKCIGCFYYLND